MTVVVIGDDTGRDFAGTEDTELLSAFPTTNLQSEAAVQSPFLLRFDLSPIVGSNTVSDSKLSLKTSSGSGGSGTITAKNVLVTWVVSQATWNDRITSTGWTTAGCQSDGNDRTAAASASLSYPGGFNTDRMVSASNSGLITNVQGVVDGGANNGHLLEFSVPGSLSSEQGSDGDRPYIEVTYTASGGGDPEGRLVGGKLMRGGFLTGGVLVG